VKKGGKKKSGGGRGEYIRGREEGGNGRKRKGKGDKLSESRNGGQRG